MLIDFKADINHQNADKNTALHVAVYAGATEVAKLLVSQGAKLELANKAGQTALEIAEGSDKTDIVRLIKMRKTLSACKTRVRAGMAFSAAAKSAS